MKYAGLAALAVALAPIAHAQDCAPLDRVVAAAFDGFESIAGEEADDGFFETTISFFNADDCAIDAFEGQYYCLWARPTVADADKAIAPLYDMAKVCLSGDWKWDDLAGKKSTSSMTITEGYRMTKTKGANKDASVRVYMEGAPGEAWRQVWLQVE